MALIKERLLAPMASSSTQPILEVATPWYHVGSPLEYWVKNVVERNAVVVFGATSCCLSYAIKSLLHNLGVSPAVIEINGESKVVEMEDMLKRFVNTGHGAEANCIAPINMPVVFIGGSLMGGLDRVLSAHICGTLVPKLKTAGALWL